MCIMDGEINSSRSPYKRIEVDTVPKVVTEMICLGVRFGARFRVSVNYFRDSFSVLPDAQPYSMLTTFGYIPRPNRIGPTSTSAAPPRHSGTTHFTVNHPQTTSNYFLINIWQLCNYLIGQGKPICPPGKKLTALMIPRHAQTTSGYTCYKVANGPLTGLFYAKQSLVPHQTNLHFPNN